jgi:hypothetical protein
VGSSSENAGRLNDEERTSRRGFLRVHHSLLRPPAAELSSAGDLPLRACEVLPRLGVAPGLRPRTPDLSRPLPLGAGGVALLVGRPERSGLPELHDDA